ncbi:MAG: phenylacetate--CoA ligase [Lentisphaerae bacterium]|nr:phenylacetate--CoA ligase [Lentisphaerota bacterium]
MANFEFWNDGNTPLHPASAPDFVPRPQMEQMQLHRLQVMVRRAYENVPLFRGRCEERKVTPDDVKSLADIARLPFSVKSDLRDTYPYGLFASPLDDVVRIHASSGTTGKPIVVGYTKGDLEVWENVITRSLAAIGVRRGDVLHNAYGYGMFTGGLGLHNAQAMGVTVIPVGGGNTERQIMLLRDLGITVISCTPSYFLHILDEAAKVGLDFHSLPLKYGIFGAEPWTEEMRQRIEEASGIKAYDIYGLTEIIGPGVAMECTAQSGMHIFEDHFYPEVVDPETGEVLPDGETGELILTTLSKAATPMIRYRTRDITWLNREVCACGRTLRRIMRVSARSDDMLIIRGVNVFPSQIEAALMQVDAAAPHYQIIVTRENDLDRMEIEVEIRPEHASDEIKQMEALRLRMSQAIERITNIRAKVTLVQPNSLARSEGKAKRVKDLR